MIWQETALYLMKLDLKGIKKHEILKPLETDLKEEDYKSN